MATECLGHLYLGFSFPRGLTIDSDGPVLACEVFLDVKKGSSASDQLAVVKCRRARAGELLLAQSVSIHTVDLRVSSL